VGDKGNAVGLCLRIEFVEPRNTARAGEVRVPRTAWDAIIIYWVEQRKGKSREIKKFVQVGNYQRGGLGQQAYRWL